MSTPAPPVVLHLIDTGGPGGAETVFSQLASRLGEHGTRSLTVVPREGWLSNQLRSLGLQPIFLDAKGSLNVRFLLALAGTARRHRAQLIHTHLLGSAIYGALLGFMTRTKVIAVIHGPHDLRSIGKLAGLKRWLLLHGCAAVVAVSTSTREALMAFGVPSDSITLIQNGIDTRRYTPGHDGALRKELGVAPGEVLIGAVGNIRGPKAYDVLLHAVAATLQRAPHCHFAIVGQGDAAQMQPLEALRDSLGIGARCHFLGFRKSTPELYRNFDIFVSSSRSEGLSLAFLEAMATGLPVVATRSGGPQEVVEPDVSGILVPVEDPAALAQGLIRAAGDAELRARLGAAARARVEAAFSLESVLRAYAELYERFLPQRQAR